MEPFELYRVDAIASDRFIRVYTDGAKLWSPDIGTDGTPTNVATYTKEKINGYDWFLPDTGKEYFGTYNEYTTPYSVYTKDSGVKPGTSTQLEAAFLNTNGVPIANSAYVKQQIAIKSRRNTLNNQNNVVKQLMEAIKYQNKNQAKLLKVAEKNAEQFKTFFTTVTGGYADKTKTS